MHKKYLRKIILSIALITCAFAAPARADFATGLQLYAQSNFEKAYEEFIQSAQYGYSPAQYNLGVMYARGQFVKRDVIAAYAWLKMAAQDKQYADKAQHMKIYTQLSDENKKIADEAYNALFNQYGAAAIEKKMNPELANSKTLSQKLRVLKMNPALFPGTMKNKFETDVPRPFAPNNEFEFVRTLDSLQTISHTQGNFSSGQSEITTRESDSFFSDLYATGGQSGIVDLSFTIDKEGKTSDHAVYFASTTAFAKAALEAARSLQFAPTLVNGKPVVLNGVKFRYIFKLNKDHITNDNIKSAKKNLMEKTNTNKVEDQYNYAYFLDLMPALIQPEPADEQKDTLIVQNKALTERQDNPNYWYVIAAKNGDAKSSFMLAQNFLNGYMCIADTNKAMLWLYKAASQNVVDAQYMLAQELFSGTHIDKNEEQAMYWLNKAATGTTEGNIAPRLRLAWILATHPDPSKRNGALAAEKIKSVDGFYHDKQTYYKTAAAVAAELGDFDSAETFQKKALSDAKDMELPIQAIEAQLNAYQNKQARREAL